MIITIYILSLLIYTFGIYLSFVIMHHFNRHICRIIIGSCVYLTLCEVVILCIYWIPNDIWWCKSLATALLFFQTLLLPIALTQIFLLDKDCCKLWKVIMSMAILIGCNAFYYNHDELYDPAFAFCLIVDITSIMPLLILTIIKSVTKYKILISGLITYIIVLIIGSVEEFSNSFRDNAFGLIILSLIPTSFICYLKYRYPLVFINKMTRLSSN